MEKEEFYGYVLSFYGPEGIYPMGATLEQIKEATELMIERRKAEGIDVDFDSFDREAVRDIMIERFGLVFPVS